MITSGGRQGVNQYPSAVVAGSGRIVSLQLDIRCRICLAHLRRSKKLLSSVDLIEYRASVHRDVVGLIALYFVLGLVLASAMHMPLIINILCVNLDDLATDAAGLRIPAYVIADF